MSRTRRSRPPGEGTGPTPAPSAPGSTAPLPPAEPLSSSTDPWPSNPEPSIMAEAEPSRVGAAPEVDPRPIPSAAYSSPPPRRSSWLPGLIGGLLGGAIVAVAGYWYTITQPFVPPVLTARLEALEATRPRLDSVAGEAASLRERSEVTASTIGNLQSRLASLEQAGAS